MPDKHTFQKPRGTRDFYPQDMAIRRYIEGVWREVSINHGFEEIEGPMFEHLDLYTVKSGEGIVNELFSFMRAGGKTQYALRPEFTPTLARMYAANAAKLPKPTKWFVIPNHFRAERPQRGRLREFMQWNADVIGVDNQTADIEIIALTIGILERLGLTPDQIQIKINDRSASIAHLKNMNVSNNQIEPVLQLIDRQDRMREEDKKRNCEEIGIDYQILEAFKPGLIDIPFEQIQFDEFLRNSSEPLRGVIRSLEPFIAPLRIALNSLGIADWCRFNVSIVRGLAYYTGTVFEVHETSGKERAIAGGGRYDQLIKMFGGKSTPAVGIAMGDVVLRLVLEDHGLLEPALEYMPRPDVFIIAAKEETDDELKKMVAKLRHQGLHVRHSYRTTRNVGKLLGEAGKARARLAVILGDELGEGLVALKNLESGDQKNVNVSDLERELKIELNSGGE